MRPRPLLPSLVLLACGSAPAPSPPAPGGAPAPPALKAPTRSEPTDAKGVAAPAMPGKNAPAVKVNTVGYPPAWKKIVVFNDEPRRAVVRDERGAVAYEIPAERISARGRNEASGDVWDAGFVSDGGWEKGSWAVSEPHIHYNANLVLVAAEMVGS